MALHVQCVGDGVKTMPDSHEKGFGGVLKGENPPIWGP